MRGDEKGYDRDIGFLPYLIEACILFADRHLHSTLQPERLILLVDVLLFLLSLSLIIWSTDLRPVTSTIV